MATGSYTDSSTNDLTTSVSWSSDTDVATILAGSATTVDEGSSAISASLSGITSNSASLTVTAAELASIMIEATTDILVVGRSSTYTATGGYTDGTSVDISSSVAWGSSDTDLVTIVSGAATAVAQGSAVISASYSGINSSDNLSLIDEVPVCGSDSAAGACIQVTAGASGDALGKEFTSTPSLAVLISMGYTRDTSESNTGTTYRSTYEGGGVNGPIGTFTRMLQVGDSIAQSTRYCSDLNNVSLNGKTDWRQATYTELLALYNDYPAGELYTTHGWSVEIN